MRKPTAANPHLQKEESWFDFGGNIFELIYFTFIRHI